MDKGVAPQRIELDSRALRDVFGAFPTGVTAVCGLRDGVPVGLAATAFTPVSLDPPLVSICIQTVSETWPKLQGLPAIGVSVLGATQEPVCRSLADKYGDRFAAVTWTTDGSSAVFIDGSLAWLECLPEQEVEAGDHTLVLLRLRSVWHEPTGAPLIFHRSAFRQLLTSTPDPTDIA